MIRFQCPSCKREYSVDNTLAGRSTKCTWCGAALIIPEPYAAGTDTDEERDPRLLEAQHDAQQAVNEGDRPGNNPFQLPQYRDQQGYTGDPGSGSQMSGWVIFIIIIVLLNVILVPLTGFAIIPR